MCAPPRFSRGIDAPRVCFIFLCAVCVRPSLSLSLVCSPTSSAPTFLSYAGRRWKTSLGNQLSTRRTTSKYSKWNRCRQKAGRDQLCRILAQRMGASKGGC